jgi:hypothetical protein
MPDNPYMTVGAAPSYAAPLMDWQGIASNIGNNLTQRPQQPGQQPGQAAGPMNIRPSAQMQGMPQQPGQPPFGQGWGQRLQQWLAQMGGPQQARPGVAPGAPQFGGLQPPVPTAQGPVGLY